MEAAHYNGEGRVVPQHLWNVADAVNQLVKRKGVLERWRGQVKECLRSEDADLKDLAGVDQWQDWLEECRRVAGQDTVTAPEGDQWRDWWREECLRRALPEPPDTDRRQGKYRPAPGAPLDFDLPMPGKYMVLAALHDFATPAGVVPIHDEPNWQAPEAVAYACLKVRVEKFSQADADKLMEFLDDVRQDFALPLEAAPLVYLTDEDWAILTALADAPKLLTQEEIAGATSERVAVRTIQRRLKVLEGKGLVCRPEGKRSGWGLTDTGLEAVRHRK